MYMFKGNYGMDN